jgi:hypothetical protein
MFSGQIFRIVNTSSASRGYFTRCGKSRMASALLHENTLSAA